MNNHFDENTARVYRTVTPDYTCPYGIKAISMLENNGIAVEDRHLQSAQEEQDFKRRQGVESTPQIFVGESHIGGYEDLRRYLGQEAEDPQRISYRPLIAVYALSLCLAAAICVLVYGTVLTPLIVVKFAAVAICLMALLKMQDAEAFSNLFLNYDLLARKWVGYAYFNPYAEVVAAVLILAGLLSWLSGPLALIIGGIGVASLLRVIYIDKRSLQGVYPGRAVGAPVELITLSKNVMLIGVGLWALVSG